MSSVKCPPQTTAVLRAVAGLSRAPVANALSASGLSRVVPRLSSLPLLQVDRGKPHDELDCGDTTGNILLEFVFPYPEHSDARAFELLRRGPVLGPVSLDLGGPVFGV
jgi:hypothetical protein